MGYQTGDDGVPGRGTVATLMSHQSEILHSLIFYLFTLHMERTQLIGKTSKSQVNFQRISSKKFQPCVLTSPRTQFRQTY